jgi:hypothetical protein
MLEIFLYKNDSKQYDSQINAIINEMDILKKNSNQLQHEFGQSIDSLNNLIEDNLSLKEKLNDIQEYLSEKIENTIEKLKDSETNKIKDMEIKVKMIKKDLIIASTSAKVDKTKLHSLIPILLDNERVLLMQWFNNDFDLVFTYESI